MGNRHADWLRQAEADLRHARNALRDGDHYIPTRYPNGFDQGAPTDYYGGRGHRRHRGRRERPGFQS